jgi:flagellar basal-body rod protein FlgC
MSLFDTLSISASALTAQQLRMDVISQNMANVDTTRTAEGGPYRRRNVLFQEFKSDTEPFHITLRNQIQNAALIHGQRGFLGGKGAIDPRSNKGVIVRSIMTDNVTPGNMVYDPGHPDANDEGYVEKPNVNVVTEMVDLISASRSYEANIAAMSVTKNIINKTLEINR